MASGVTAVGNRPNFIDLLLLTMTGVALVGMIYCQFYWPVNGKVDVTGHPLGRDFINVWAGPQVAFSHQIKQLFDLGAYHRAIGEFFGTPIPFHNWGYPLFVLPVYWFFAQLPYLVALAAWTLIFFSTFSWIVVREVERSRRLLALALLAVAPAALINTIGGQNGFITAALLLGGILFLERRPILAGMFMGLLLYKPHLGICLPFVLIALGAWRTFAAAAATAVLLVLSSFLFATLSDWADYFRIVGPYQNLLLQNFHGFYVNMMVSFASGLRSIGLGYTPAMLLQVCLSLPVLVLTVRAVRQTADPCIRAFVVAAASLLITPYAFNYDMTAVSAAMVWLLVGRLDAPREWHPVVWVAWLTPALVMIPAIRTLSMAPIATIALFALSLTMARRSGTAGSPSVGKTPEPDARAPAPELHPGFSVEAR